MSDYDVIIIGAGHNGLVAGSYLAKAGRKVAVVEKSAEVGGAAVSEEFAPGFTASTCAGGAGYLSERVIKELKLEAHGLAIRPSDAVAFVPQPDGSSLTIWRDTQRTVAEIEKFSGADAAAYPGFLAAMRPMADVVRGLLEITPPDLPEVGWADLASAKILAGPMRRLGRKNASQFLKVLPMPAADLLQEWFESDVLMGAISASGVRDITWGPREAGTAYTLLYKWALSNNGLFRSSGGMKGGMGAIVGAIASAARAHGVEILTDNAVEKILLEGENATGVRLAGGETLSARTIVSSADPRTTFTQLLDPSRLDLGVVRSVRNIKYRGSAARIHLALGALPEFTALAGIEGYGPLEGAIQIAPNMTYIQRAYDCTKYGNYSPHPYLDIEIPTLADPELAPAGQHVMSITAKYAPYALRSGSWEGHREAFVDAVLSTLAEYAPNLRDSILHKEVLLPSDLETRFSLPEGNGDHGEMTLDQFLHMRPLPGYARYQAPVRGLYLCGAGSHPGGGVTGLPGHNAAREILKNTG
jgi:phytoene dehydrogenase-like protein